MPKQRAGSRWAFAALPGAMLLGLVSGCGGVGGARAHPVVASAGPPYQQGPWHMLGGSAVGEGISGPGNCTPQGLAVDSHGRPHVIWDAWQDGPEQTTQVCYAYWDGRRWTGLGGSMQAGGVSHSKKAGSTRARLAVDRDGRPHIAWINNETYAAIEYRHWDGQAWRASSIPTIGNETGELSLAVDGKGRPHVASIERSEVGQSPWPRLVRYRYWDGQRWRERVREDGRLIHRLREDKHNLGGVAIALDDQGRPHLAYGDDTHIYYAYWDGQDWRDHAGSSRPPGVDRTDNRSFMPWLSVDDRGRVHIVWREEVKGDLLEIYYRFWDGQRWAEADGSGSGCGLSRLGRNSFTPQVAAGPLPTSLQAGGGRVHVLWCGQVEQDAETEVYYRYWSGLKWCQVVGSGSGLGLSSNRLRSNWVQLAVDQHGRPHVAWGNHAAPSPPHVYYVYLP